MDTNDALGSSRLADDELSLLSKSQDQNESRAAFHEIGGVRTSPKGSCHPSLVKSLPLSGNSIRRLLELFAPLEPRCDGGCQQPSSRSMTTTTFWPLDFAPRSARPIASSPSRHPQKLSRSRFIT